MSKKRNRLIKISSAAIDLARQLGLAPDQRDVRDLKTARSGTARRAKNRKTT